MSSATSTSSWQAQPSFAKVTDAIWPRESTPKWCCADLAGLHFDPSVTLDPHYPLDDPGQGWMRPHLGPWGQIEMLPVRMTPRASFLTFWLLFCVFVMLPRAFICSEMKKGLERIFLWMLIKGNVFVGNTFCFWHDDRMYVSRGRKRWW